VDAGYQGRGKEWAEQELGLSVEVVHRTPKPKQPRRLQGSGQRNGTRKATRSTGRSCFHVGALRFCRGGG
jgi:hypothetical protein